MCKLATCDFAAGFLFVCVFGYTMIIRHSCVNTRGARELVAKWAQNWTDNKAAIVADQRRINGIPFSVALSERPPVPLPARPPRVWLARLLTAAASRVAHLL